MTYAYSISIFCSLLFAWFINFKENNIISKRNLFLFLLVNTIGLYFTYSRGAMVGFLVAIPFAFVRKNGKTFKLLLLGATLLMSFFSYLFLKNKSVDFYRLDFSPKKESQRISLLYTAAHIIKDNPFFGIGYRNFESSVTHYKKKYDLNKINPFVGHAHNNYIEILTGAGLFALFFYLLFMGSWLQMCLKSNLLFLIILVPPLINFSFSGLFQSTIIDGEVTFLFMLLFGLTGAAKINQNIKEVKGWFRKGRSNFNWGYNIINCPWPIWNSPNRITILNTTTSNSPY